MKQKREILIPCSSLSIMHHLLLIFDGKGLNIAVT